METNPKNEGVAELKFWNFNVPYKAYMALTNVKTLQLWKFCNTLAIDWKYAVCGLSEVFCLRAFCEPPPMMVGLTIKASSPMTFHFDTPSFIICRLYLKL